MFYLKQVSQRIIKYKCMLSNRMVIKTIETVYWYFSTFIFQKKKQIEVTENTIIVVIESHKLNHFSKALFENYENSQLLFNKSNRISSFWRKQFSSIKCWEEILILIQTQIGIPTSKVLNVISLHVHWAHGLWILTFSLMMTFQIKAIWASFNNIEDLHIFKCFWYSPEITENKGFSCHSNPAQCHSI